MYKTIGFRGGGGGGMGGGYVLLNFAISFKHNNFNHQKKV